MKAIYCAALLSIAGLGLTGCSSFSDWHTVRGSGTIVTEARQVSGFDQVSVSGSGEIVVEQGGAESLTIEADDNLLPLIQSDVHGGHLSIGPRNVNLHPTGTIRYRLKLKDLSDLHLSGSVNADLGDIHGAHLALALSGSGRIRASSVEVQTLSTGISGSGYMTASGRAEKQVIRISGSGNHDAPNLKCARADVHISGSGSASLWATDTLAVHVSGSGSVVYRGNAAVDSHISGSGRVRHRSGTE